MAKRGRIPSSGRKTTNRQIFEDPQKLKGRILGIMRKDAKKSPMFAAAKKKSFLGDAIYQCPDCGKKVYTGTSDKNYEKLCEEHIGLIRGKESRHFDLDHIDPIVPYDTTTKDMGLDELAPRVYCHEDNLTYICKECHREKTAKEKTIRAKYQKLKKLEEK